MLFVFGIFRPTAAVKFILFLHLYRSETHMLVQGLEPKTMYEFAVRLHVDQLSSPWSPVVYHTTLPEGKALREEHVVLKRKLCKPNGLKNCLLILSCLKKREILYSEIQILLLLVRDRKMLSGKSLFWNCEIICFSKST